MCAERSCSSLCLRSSGEPVIKDRWAVVAAVVIGLLLSVLAHVGASVPGVGNWLDVVGAGMLAGLSACGLFSGGKKRETTADSDGQ